MRLVLTCAIVLVGCGRSVPDFPIGPPGGGSGHGGGGSGNADAAVGGDGSSGTISGQVCLTSDPRVLNVACATTGVDNITVTLGTEMATTAADGTFTINAPTGSNLIWTAAGAAIHTSAMSFGTTAKIPAIDPLTYTDMIQTNLVNIDEMTQGSIIATVTQQGIIAVGATAASTPSSLNAIMYDGGDKITWDTVMTSTHGDVWVAGLPAAAGSVSLRITNSGETKQVTVNAVPVVAGAITFVSADIP